jgi:hypothetical protein
MLGFFRLGIAAADQGYLFGMIELAAGEPTLTMSGRELAQHFRCSEAWARKVVKGLLDAGHLVVEHQHRSSGWHAANIYKFADSVLAAWRELIPPPAHGGVRSDVPRTTGCAQERSLETPSSLDRSKEAERASESPRACARGQTSFLDLKKQGRVVSRRCAPSVASPSVHPDHPTSESRPPADPLAAERRAKRQNLIKTMRRWVQIRITDLDERAAELAFLEKQEAWVYQWDGRGLDDRQRFDRLVAEMAQNPLTPAEAKAFWWEELPPERRHRAEQRGAGLDNSMRAIAERMAALNPGFSWFGATA